MWHIVGRVGTSKTAMYRFRKENWARKVDESYPKYWSRSGREYGFFMEQPQHMAESQFMETHSHRVQQNPYTAHTVPRARKSVADKITRKRPRTRKQRVGVHYDYDDGNDMWDVLQHRENPSTGVRRLPRSLSPIARRATLSTKKKGSPEDAQPILVDNPWYPMIRTKTATGRSSFGRVAHSRHGYQVGNGRFGDELEGDVSPGKTDDHHRHATDYNRVKTPKVAIINGLHGNHRMETGSFRSQLQREPTAVNKNNHTGSFRSQLQREPTAGNKNNHIGQATDYSRVNTPGLSREYTLGPRLHTFGPREDHGLPEPDHLNKMSPGGQDGSNTASRRGRSLSPMGNRNYSAARSRIGSPTMRNRKETLNERFFRFNFHEPWKASIRT